MRSLHTLRSTHGHRLWISSACLTHGGTATDFCSESLAFTLLPFLCPFAPRALPRFDALTDTLSSGRGRLFGPFGHEHRLLVPTRDPCLLSLNLPTVPSPTTRCRPRLFGLTSQPRLTARVSPCPSCGTFASWASPFPSRLAADNWPNRVRFLRTSSSSPVALHPALRRRSYLQLPRPGPTPRGDFHPADSVHSQAH